MFGYINTQKSELKIKDYNTYRAVYCGICKTYGKKLGLLSRFCTSYDTTFLCLVLLAVTGEEIKATPQRCVLKPFSKRLMQTYSHAGLYAAYAGMMLSYLKLRDDWRDEKKLFSLIGMAALRRAAGRARKKFPVLYAAIEEGIDKLAVLEKQGCSSADVAADAFACVTAVCFTPDFVPEEQKKQLYWLGYYLGRWVYLIDAVGDLESDIKKGNYNPYTYSYRTLKAVAEFARLPMTLTLQSAAAVYELLDIKQSKELLDNIIYLGLLQKQEQIFAGYPYTRRQMRNGEADGSI